MKQYIGIKRAVKGSPSSNWGDIWTEGEDGKYRCPKHPDAELEKFQILHDLKLVYLKEYEQEILGSNEVRS